MESTRSDSVQVEHNGPLVQEEYKELSKTKKIIRIVLLSIAAAIVFIVVIVPVVLIPDRPPPTQIDWIIAVTTAPGPALPPNFYGINSSFNQFPINYTDSSLYPFIEQLRPQWLRYPGGIVSDGFNWSSGLYVSSWVETYSQSSVYQTLLAAQANLESNSPNYLSNFNTLMTATNVPAVMIVVDVVNDTPESAGLLAAKAKSLKMNVIAYELGSELYLTGGSFNYNAFRTAIKIGSGTTPAYIAFGLDINGNPVKALAAVCLAVANYSNLDYVVINDYPTGNPTDQTLADNIITANTYFALFPRIFAFLLNPILLRKPSQVLLINEFATPGAGSSNDFLTGTTFAGLYNTAYVIRAANFTQIAKVGWSNIIGPNGITFTSNGNGGNTYNTSTPADFYAQAANILSQASNTLNTTIYPVTYFNQQGNPVNVTINLNLWPFILDNTPPTCASGFAPTVNPNSVANSTGAVYGQGFVLNDKRHAIILTNFCNQTQFVEVFVDGTAFYGSLNVTRVYPNNGDVTQKLNIDQDIDVESPVAVQAYGMSIITYFVSSTR